MVVVDSSVIELSQLKRGNTNTTMSTCKATPDPSDWVGSCATMDQAIKDGAAVCGSAFGGKGYAAPQHDPACPAPIPYRAVCSSDQGGASFCCTHGDTEGNESCSVCPQHGCDSVLGRSGTGVCFAESTACSPNENPAANGEAVGSCPVLVSTTSLGRVCRSWCAANPEACTRSMNAFCSNPANTSSPACSCVAPWYTTWGELSYDALTRIVQANPKVQQQLDSQTEGSGLDIGCVWPPCNAANKGVMVPPARHCPAISNLCVNVLEDVHIQDVVAGRVDVGACVKGGDPDSAASGAVGRVAGGLHHMPLVSSVQLWITQHVALSIVIGAVLLVVLAVVAFLVLRPPTPLQRFEAAMATKELVHDTRTKEGYLADAMLHSANPHVRAKGKLLQARLRSEQRDAARDKAARRSSITHDLASLAPSVATNDSAALHAAILQAERRALTP